jgi:hypothetical protein
MGLPRPGLPRHESQTMPSQGHLRGEGVPRQGASLVAGYPPRGNSSGRHGTGCASLQRAELRVLCGQGEGLLPGTAPGTAAPSPEATPPTDVVPGAPLWLGRRHWGLGSSSGARRPLRYAHYLLCSRYRSSMGNTKPDACSRVRASAARQAPRGRDVPRVFHNKAADSLSVHKRSCSRSRSCGDRRVLCLRRARRRRRCRSPPAKHKPAKHTLNHTRDLSLR